MRPLALPGPGWSIWDQLCQYHDIVLLLTTKFLTPSELVSMYCISRDFYFLVNSHKSKVIRASAQTWARLRPIPHGVEYSSPLTPYDLSGASLEQTPQAVVNAFDILPLFPYTLYSNLCDSDPAANCDSNLYCGIIPKVPSLKYLLFLEYRCHIIHSIVRELAAKGHLLPYTTPRVLAKIWLLMDVPTNKYRLALIHNKIHWTDDDLLLASFFILKLDMAFQDPLSDEGRAVMRYLSLAQRSLSTLARILKREEARNTIELVCLYLRWKYRPSLAHQHYSILGVPPQELGKLQLEGWGLSDQYWGSQKPVDILNYLRVRATGNQAAGTGGARPQDPSSSQGSATNSLRSNPVGRQRQILLRPDQLVLREVMQRKLEVDSFLIHVIRWGFINPRTLENYPPSKTEK